MYLSNSRWVFSSWFFSFLIAIVELSCTAETKVMFPNSPLLTAQSDPLWRGIPHLLYQYLEVRWNDKEGQIKKRLYCWGRSVGSWVCESSLNQSWVLIVWNKDIFRPPDGEFCFLQLAIIVLKHTLYVDLKLEWEPEVKLAPHWSMLFRKCLWWMTTQCSIW